MSVLEPRGARRLSTLPSRLALAGFVLVACGIAERRVDESDAAGTPAAGAGSGTAKFDRGGMFGSGGTGTAVGGSVGYGTGGLGFMPGGAGYPPKNFAGAPATGSCFNIPKIWPTCSPSDALGGAAGDAASGVGGEAASGAGGEATSEASASGAPSGAGTGGKSGGVSSTWCVPDGTSVGVGSDQLLIDDFEDGDDASPFFLGGRGAWFAVNDGSGLQFPMPCTVPSELDVHRDGSLFAMHTYGQGFVNAPGGYSLVGMSVKRGPACNEPIDASSFVGVQFWARGIGVARFFIATVETNPFADFGACSERCYDSHGYVFPLAGEWQLVRVPFAALTQEGWGTPAFFDPAKLLALEWSGKEPSGTVPASCFDFWIDDVAFYR